MKFDHLAGDVEQQETIDIRAVDLATFVAAARDVPDCSGMLQTN